MDLPSRWVEFYDDEGEPYYYRPATGDKTRDRPFGVTIVSEEVWEREEPTGADEIKSEAPLSVPTSDAATPLGATAFVLALQKATQERDKLRSDLYRLKLRLSQETRLRLAAEATVAVLRQQAALSEQVSDMLRSAALPVTPATDSTATTPVPLSIIATQGGSTLVKKHSFTFQSAAAAGGRTSPPSRGSSAAAAATATARSSRGSISAAPSHFSALPGLNFSTLAFLKSVPLLQSFSEDQFLRLATRLKTVTFAPRDVIYRQGDEGAAFYIIEKGAVNVYARVAGAGSAGPPSPQKRPFVGVPVSTPGSPTGRASSVGSSPGPRRSVGGGSDDGIYDVDDEPDARFGLLVAELVRGSFFGERALLTQERRERTCVAGDAEVVAYELSRRAFEQVLSSIEALLDDTPFVVTPAFLGGSSSEAAEVAALERHVSSYALLLQRARDAGLGPETRVDRDSNLDPERTLLRIMSVFAPEMSLLEIVGRVRRTLRSSVDALHCHILLHDASSEHFVLLPRDHLSFSVSAPDAAADTLPLVRLGGSVAPSGLLRVPTERCGILAQALQDEDVVAVDDVAACTRLTNGHAWSAAHAALDALLGIPTGTSSCVAAPVILGSGRIAAMILLASKHSTAGADLSAPAESGDEETAADESGIDYIAAENEHESRAVPASQGWQTARRAQHLISMRTWSLQRTSSVVNRTTGAFGDSSGSSGKRLSFSVVNPLSRALALVPLDDGRGKEAHVAMPPPPPPRKASALKPHACAFTERDVRVVAGVAAELALALEDRSLECATLVGEREYTVVGTLRDFVRMHVDSVSGIEVPVTARVKVVSSAREAVESVSTDAPVISRASSYSELVNGAYQALPLRSAGSIHVSALLVHGSQVLSSTKSAPADLVSAAQDVSVPYRSFPVRCDQVDPTSPTIPMQILGVGDQKRGMAGWTEPLVSLVRYFNLPVATRAIFVLTHAGGAAIGWAGLNIFSPEQELRSGTFGLRLWPGPFDIAKAAHATCLSNPALDASVVTLSVRLPEFGCTVVRGCIGVLNAGSVASAHIGVVLSPEATELASGYVSERVSAVDYPSLHSSILRIVGYDPLHSLAPEEARLLWLCRERLTGMPAALPKFLHAVRWDDAASVDEAHRLLMMWRPPSPLQALELLQASVPDRTVRGYAVSRLELLNDEELSAFLLQLVSVCRYEPFLDSSLVRFLLRRALASPRSIGHQLFWLLRAELHVPLVAVRYSVILQQFLEHAGDAVRVEFGRQSFVVQRLQDTARRVKAAGSREARAETLTAQLSTIVFPDSFQLPLAPEFSSSGVRIRDSRVMSSKKLPLWLTMEPATSQAAAVSPASPGVAGAAAPAAIVRVEQPPKTILFKLGDDLRQDQLTLQVLGVMHRVWLAEGLDLCVSAYRCVSTGVGLGMLEVVRDADTLATIMSHSIPGQTGVAHKIRAALQVYSSVNVYRDWLEAHQHSVPGGIDHIEHNFVHSCAAYVVATYVLGIGDRHNDNIMLTRAGRLFHIGATRWSLGLRQPSKTRAPHSFSLADFGHFLGNFKKKLGYLRERAPFVFTPHMAAVMGGPGSPLFSRFEDLACRAYLILRKHGHTLIVLFSLMVSCGLPELQSERDVDWLRQKLLLEKSDAEASAHLKHQIAIAISTRATQFNDACHLLKHA